MYWTEYIPMIAVVMAVVLLICMSAVWWATRNPRKND